VLDQHVTNFWLSLQTLSPEGEHEEASSRRGDCGKPHGGRLHDEQMVTSLADLKVILNRASGLGRMTELTGGVPVWTARHEC
jgi:hypothetical protein